MTSGRRPYFPSFTLVAALALAAVYLAVFLPLRQRVREADAPLKEVWARFVDAYASSDACVGITREQLPARLTALEATARDLQAAAALVDSRLTWPTQVQAVLRQPFQFVEFQNECQRDAESLLRLGKDRGVAFDSALTTRLADALGLSEYTADHPDPAILWARLHATHHFVLAAIEAKVTVIKAVQQLPAITHRSLNDRRELARELPMRIEVAGPMPQLARLLAALPLPGAELGVMGLGGPLTNKPVLFLGQVLLRKSAPVKEGEAPRAGEVLMEVNATALAPPTGDSAHSSPD